MTNRDDGLTGEEALAGGLMNAMENRFGAERLDAVIAEMDPKSANDATRARDIGRQMKGRKR